MSPTFGQNLRAARLCYGAHLMDSTSSATKMLLPILFSTLVLVFIVGVVNLVDARYAAPGEEPVIAAPGPRLVTTLMTRLFETSPESTKTTTQRGPLEGVRLHIQAPDNIQDRTWPLLATTGVENSTEAHAQLVLHWEGKQWKLSGVDSGNTVLAWTPIREALNPPNPIEEQWLKVWRPVEERSAGEASNKKFRNSLLSALVPVAILLPLMFILGTMCTTMCFDIDRSRSSGLLESFALAPMPFWTFLLPLAMAKATWATIGATGLLLVAGVFLPSVSVVTLMCMAGGVFFICTALAMLGCLQVLLFHHRHSRLIGGLFLNPVALSMPLVAVLMPLTGYVSKALGSPASLNDLPLVGMAPLQAFVMLGAIGIAATAATAVLCWAVEKRLGPRRTGLAVI